MDYHLFNSDFRHLGVVGEKPVHSNWTLTPYMGGLVKEFWNGSAWIESATVEQIAADTLIREDAEDLAEQLLLEEKGNALIHRTKKRLIRRFKKGLITKPQTKKVREILNPIFLFLKTGDLDIANDKAIALPVDANANVQAELTWFKERILELQ